MQANIFLGLKNYYNSDITEQKDKSTMDLGCCNYSKTIAQIRLKDVQINKESRYRSITYLNKISIINYKSIKI